MVATVTTEEDSGQESENESTGKHAQNLSQSDKLS